MITGLLAAPALGQESTGGLEEIIVTAEFRAANVQDTPIAITAVNAEMLEARSQTNLSQITAQMPNVSLRPAGSAFGSALVAFIRGIGQTDFNPSVEPGIGIYVDDIYYSTITGNLLDLLDLERVEVLRGPQGTLAGRNAIGGAIKLFTRKPDGGDDAERQLDERRVQPHGDQGRGRHYARSRQALHAHRGRREVDGRLRDPPRLCVCEQTAAPRDTGRSADLRADASAAR